MSVQTAPVSVTFVKAKDGREGVYINNVLILESQSFITTQALAAKLGFDVAVMESDEGGPLPFHLDKINPKEYAV